MRRFRFAIAAMAAIPLFTVLSTAAVPTAGADTPALTRIETPVTTSSPITSVAESEVSVYLPLPASVGPHPAACDWLSYLRYRAVDGPTNSADADKILVAQPGILEGAGAFDSVARDTVAAADKLGKHIEFWALDRRSNCLEDHTGVQAALAAKDPTVAVNYYYNGTSIDGHTFAGYLGNDQVGWLADIGIAQTVQDEYDLLAEELPSQPLRKQKLLCGGHSLGGTITAFFADWDFGTDPGDTSQAGYNQCGGYFALDTAISTSLASLSGTPSGLVPDPALTYDATQAALDSGVLTRTVSLPVLINAETMNLLAIAGVAADVDPQGVSDLASILPDTTNINTTLRFLFSRDYANFVTGTPAAKDFNLTNQAALGALLDDNSQPLAFLQTAVGFFGGGPVVDKSFPAPNDLASIPGLSGIASLLGTSKKAVPATPDGPLYTWRDYDQLSNPADPIPVSSDGTPFTSPAAEVTDIQELARSLAEQPLDFTEDYFPTKIVTDIYQQTAPQIADHLVYPDGTTANPVINLLGGDGLVVASGNLPPGQTVIAPGYHHLDVLTASPVQNNGLPEPISTNLAEFAAGR